MEKQFASYTFNSWTKECEFLLKKAEKYFITFEEKIAYNQVWCLHQEYKKQNNDCFKKTKFE